jgi:hypothetical protein
LIPPKHEALLMPIPAEMRPARKPKNRADIFEAIGFSQGRSARGIPAHTESKRHAFSRRERCAHKTGS